MISALYELYSWVQTPEGDKLRRERMRSLVVTVAAICAGARPSCGWAPPIPDEQLDELTADLVQACEDERFEYAGLLVDKYLADRPGDPFSLLGMVFAELSGLAIRREGPSAGAPCLDALMQRKVGAPPPRLPGVLPTCLGG